MEQRITTASELEQMTPIERHAHFESSIITDLDDAPPELVDRARAKALEHARRAEAHPSR